VKVYTFTPQDQTYTQSNQGNCTDGTYLYQVLLKTVNKVEYVELQKIRIWDWKLMKTVHTRKTSAYNDYEIHHGGDLCYNADTKEIVAITYSNFATAAHQLVFIDPGTLLPKRKLTVKGVTKFYAIDYEPVTKGYVATGTGKSGDREFAVYDSAFKLLAQFPIKPADKTCALSCDENYIYCLENDPRYGRFARSRLHIFDWLGGLVRTVIIPVRGEIEDIYLRRDHFYIAFTLLEKDYMAEKKHMYIRKVGPSRSALLKAPPLIPFKNERLAKRMIDWLYNTSITVEDWAK